MLVSLAWLAALAFIALALGLTISAWRVRRSTPRTLSLALSTAICAALLLVAFDFPVPGVCRGEPPTIRPDALEAELGRWRWWLSPCGRVEVTAGPEDLGTPLDLGKLTSMAVDAGVVVDVAFQRGTPAHAPQIVLGRIGDQERSFPLKTPIPGPYTDEIEPRLGGATVCSIDDGPFSSGSLADLFGGAYLDYYGFHRIVCRVPGSTDAATISGYVDITKAGVVIAGDDPDNPTVPSADDCSKTFRRYDGFESSGSHAYGLDLATRTTERCAPVSASMLVLDRPLRPETCRLAQELLDRGATVVLAMPGDDFFADDCRALRPVDPVTPARNPPSRSTKTILFDRTPRVTFLLDETLDDLKFAPTCVLQDRVRHTCASPSQWSSSSSTLQLNRARELCRSLAEGDFLSGTSCASQPAGLEARTDAHDPVLYLRRSPFKPAGDLSRLEHTAPSAGLEDLATELAAKDARVFWENEVVVTFTHDLRPSTGVDAFVERFGSRVDVVRVQDPYGTSLHTLTSDVPPRQLGTESLLSVPTTPRWSDDPGKCGNDVSRCIASIQSVYPAGPQTEAQATLPEFSRFRHGSAPQTRAPVRFSWYKLPDPRQGRLSPVQLAHTTEDAGLAKRPLAVGTMVGRGHLLILSYSPFETVKDPWRDLLDKMDLPDPAKMRLIEQFYLGTEDILAEMNGPVLSVAIQPDGALWVTVLRDTSVTSRLDILEFHGAGTTESIRAPLVDFDPTGRTLTYAIPAVELRNLTRCTPLQANLPRKKGASDENRPIYACPPLDTGANRQRWDAALALEQLAYYTGGRTRRPDDAGSAPASDAPRTRTFGLGMLAGLFLLAWGRRGVRRLGAHRAYRKLRRIDAIAQRRYDPPEAVVAAAGDWDGRTSTWPRMGAFGGYRPLEPGDRAAAIVLHDLVIREQRGTQVLPRVALRIEEAAPSVCVLLNLGESMRVPERTDSSKALFAGRVGAHVAASTWKLRGEAALHAVGIHGDTEILAPMHLSPGHEEIETNLRARLRQRPARDTTPWPDDLPECGAVVYISDFQLEDERALQAWVTRLEGEGIRVGGIMLYSPFEFTMIEGGRLAASGVWADRADWDPDDLFEAFSRRRDQIERIFDHATTGGLVVVATTFGQDDVELALADGRLLQILR